jgi:aminomethyltransferase
MVRPFVAGLFRVMTDSGAALLKKTPLYASHVALGARMVPFAGWDMPVEYSGITAEHMAVRTAAGLFDVSHMGEVEIAGKDALTAVQHITSNDASKLQVGQIQYSALTTPEGTFVDDLLVYRFGPSHYLVVINASNIDKDYAWIDARAKEAVPDVATVNSSDRYALIAVQGPRAQQILQTLTAIDLAPIKYYRFAHGEIAGVRGTVSRTGYTGEDGFEVMVPAAMAARVWDALLHAGQPAGLIPCGLGARDTLRLEASMRLYGNDMDETSTVLEADLGWIVGWSKTEFLGREPLHAQKAHGVPKKLVGFEVVDRAIARHGYAVWHSGHQVGTVTSGTQTPFLKKAIGMAYVPPALASPGTEIEIDVRGRRVKALTVPMPFYKRPKKP